jgi:signal transduction histidine kinase
VAFAWCKISENPVRATPVILLILIVCLPVALLAWLGSRMASDEQTVIEQRFRGLLTAQLRDIDQVTVGHFAVTQRELRAVAKLPSFQPADIRSRLREAPLVRQILVYSPNGDVLHPSGPLNSGEQDFLLQASDLVTDRDLFYAAGGKRRTARPPQRSSRSAAAERQPDAAARGEVQKPAESNTTPPSPSEGWHIWYFGRGVHLFYWQRLDTGHVVALLVERSRWMADLIATLPQTINSTAADTVPSPLRGEGARRADEGAPESLSEVPSSRIRLVDSVGRPVYQWGSYEPDEAALEKPFAEVPVSSPLTSWRLQAFVPPDLVQGASRSSRFSMAASLAASAVALCLLVGFFWREYRRELREASQRVSFVNQVSHELRTPLTNIRMYADLLESDLERMPDDETTQPKSRLKVIAEESQRLSRLIGNVLTMARQQRKALTLKPEPAIVDDVIRDVLRQFEPALSRGKVEATFDAASGESVSVDVDVLEQILVNLFSNVEKYAASGGALRVASSQTDTTTTITVSDAGPGIPPRQRDAIFRPFYRSSDRLVDAAGTGIGLSIARELAQLHGGDLRLLTSDAGACFEVTLKTG